VKIDGNIDRYDEYGFAGWILDRDNPRARVTLLVCRGSSLLGVCVSDQFAQVSIEGTVGNHCGNLRFSFDSRLDLPALEEVYVIVPNTLYSFSLRLGRLVVRGSAKALYDQVVKNISLEGRSPRKFSKCILHIGTEKSGSTSVQGCLGLNRDVFGSSGYFIPKSVAVHDASTIMHRPLAMISLDENNFDDDLRRDSRVVDSDSLAQARLELFSRLSFETELAPPDCDTLIVSSEHFHSRLRTREEVQNLKDFLDYFCESYKVVAYLRPQHEVAMSRYGMLIATGVCNIDMFPPFPTPEGYAKSVHADQAYFDYWSLLARWGEVFGERTISPRIYSDFGGDVVSNFISDLSLKGPLVPTSRRNTNISPSAQALMIAFYRSLEEQQQSGKSMLRHRVHSAVRDRFSGEGPTPTRSEVLAFLDVFAAGNEMVRERWFPERRQLFDIDFEKYPTMRSEVTLAGDEMARMFVEVMLTDQRAGFRLSAEELNRIKLGLAPYCDS